MPCSVLIVNRDVVAPTLNVKPPLFVMPRKFWGGDHRFIVLALILNLSLSDLKGSMFSSPMNIIARWTKDLR